ncbi:MAG: ADP-ribosylation factor-like protein [Candidatus Helarchaeota archaeon]
MEKQIAMLGVQKTGKTSCLTILRKKFGTLYKLKTTVGVERSNMNILGYDFYVADYGGQELFRNDYVAMADKFFLGNLDLLFYFVDIQSDNLDESITYFKDLLTIPKINSMDPSKIIIEIHKMDPEIRDTPEIRAKVEKVKEQFNLIKENLTYFETSIYDYWSIINCYSQGLNKITAIREIFEKLLREFARATFSSGIILLEENLFILAKHGSNEKDLQITQTALKQFMNKWVDECISCDSAQSIKNVTDFKMDLELDAGKAYFQKLSFKNGLYFIMCYSKNPRTENLILKNIPKLASRVYEISKGYFS